MTEEQGLLRRSDPRRRLVLALGIVAILVAAPVAAWFVWWSPEPAPSDAFRFDRVYVRGSADSTNETTLGVEVWFTNTHEAHLRDVRLVAVAVEANRGLAVVRSDHALGDIGRRSTHDLSFEMALNASQSYRIELLVLVDGILTVRGLGTLGWVHDYLHDSDGYLVSATLARDFAFEPVG